MIVYGDFLDVEFRANGDVGLKHRLTVFRTIDDFQQSVFRDHRAVCRRQILCSEQSELHREDFAVSADTEQLVLLQNFGETDFCLLTLVVERGFSGSHRNIFAGIGQLHCFNFAADHHTIGGFFLTNFESSKIQRFCGRSAVPACLQTSHNLFILISECSIRRIDISDRRNDIVSIRYIAYRVNRLIDAVCFRHGREHLAGLADRDGAFLCDIMLFNHHSGLCAVHLERYGRGVKDIPVCAALLN